MIHPERRRENLKKIEEINKRDAEQLQPDWKTWCMNKKVDMVEVVRCKNCKWRANNGATSTKWLPCMDHRYDDNWFCADGERR